MGKKDTKQKVLDVAERLFAEKGLQGTSLRTVTSRAKVNLASVHYHFGSKKALIHAVIARRLAPLNRERLRLLDAAEASVRGKPVSLESILHAFIAPMMRLLRENPSFVRIAGRVHSDPNKELQLFFLSQFEEIIRRFTAALRRSLPNLPLSEIFWRVHFLIGAIIHTWTNHLYLEHQSKGACSLANEHEIIQRFVNHGVATLRAPMAKRGRTRT